jgi:hypothetical protein
LDSLVATHPIHFVNSGATIPAVSIYLNTSGETTLLIYSDGATCYRRVTGPTYALSTGEWAHIACTFTGDNTDLTNINIYINGSGVTYESGGNGSGTPDSIGEVAIGIRLELTDRFFDGRIGEPACWNAVLTSGEASALGLGYSPLLVRPASLVAYWPLIGRTSPEIDRIGGYDMTLNAGPTWAAHPRVIMPESKIIGPAPAAVDVAANINISPGASYIQVV